MAAVVELSDLEPVLYPWIRRDDHERHHGTYLQTRHFQEDDDMAAFETTERGGKHNQASLFTVHLLDRFRNGSRKRVDDLL